MHRRARHLNAGHAGASVYADARYITGVTNNTRMLYWSPARWTDLSGNGNHIVGTGDSIRDPIYISSGSTISSLPVVRFIVPTFGNITAAYGSNDFNVTQNNLSAVVVASSAYGLDGRILSFNQTSVSDQAATGVGALVATNGNTILSSRKDNVLLNNGPLTANAPYVMSFLLNGSSLYNFLNKRSSVPFTVSSTLNSNQVWFGTDRAQAGNSRWSGDIGCVAIFKFSISDALRLRIGTSFATKFKVAFE